MTEDTDALYLALVIAPHSGKERPPLSSEDHTSGRDKRSIIVHHRVPGKSLMNLMLSLCPGCHAKIHRTKAVLSAMPPLLLDLWRELHPRGHEQVQINFTAAKPAAKLLSLFGEEHET